ncbi:hypothetical protein GQX73_g6079 [Xylaria multiplex]|uniref:DZF domain-containing protein n=1 Tax=Xylaria multiplex TaxID=323545 RepID=A0A7C8MPV2_9PEZI|nr:hypothetical protein GQX73_g6079 [Xylaria multiplex]
MSSSGQYFGSNNPFRRKQGGASVNPTASSGSSFGIDGARTSPTTTTRPPFTTFKSAAPESERRDEEEQPVQQKPKKIVKKVRVQSPPPSSPEDAVPVTRFPTLEGLDDDDDDDDDDSTSDSSKDNDQVDDPFDAESINPERKPATEPPLPHIPPNPFARTLQDIEGSNQAYDANATATGASASKGSLDVDSFKRLLLTGYANLPKPAQPVAESTGNPPSLGTLPDGGSATDGSSISKQSLLDALHETPRTSHEISESEASEERRGVLPTSPLATIPSASARKKPPPPSSRHGKLIKLELGADSNFRNVKPAISSGGADLALPSGTAPRIASSESLHSLQGTNVNKPLPAPPLRASADEDVESPFDREAAGKVPEAFAALQAHPRPPTPPPTTRSRSASQTSTQSHKPAVPPPRRHARSDSKIPSNYSTNADEDPPRSSIESNRSRTDSLRISMNSEKPSYAPAPPPPRRPGHARQGSSFANINHGAFSPVTSPSFSEKDRSPWGSGSTPTSSPGTQPGHSYSLSVASVELNGQTKISPPPPPPTRKQSTRRPASVRSMESSNGLAPARRVSREKDGGAPPPPPPPRARGSRPNPDSSEEGRRKGSLGSISIGNGSVTPTTVEGGKQGEEILADLDALQREVDDMMKKATS